MTSTRMELEIALKKYVSETFEHITTVKNFINIRHIFDTARQESINEMIRIMKDETDDSDEKDYLDLTVVLEKVRHGVHEMVYFLSALEMLCVTSVHVFKHDNPGFNLRGSDLQSVRSVILTAHILAPMIILFKRHNEDYFLPSLENIEVILNQLQKYHSSIIKICEIFQESSLIDQPLNEPVVEINYDLSEDEMRNILSHISTLDQVRTSEDFRMTCLFKGKQQTFMTEFETREPEMRRFLQELEGCADHLDNMCKGANITGVVGSSVSIAGGVLSILGLIFAPFSAGASLGLLVVGTAVAVTGGATSLAGSATSIGVNETEAQKAKEKFEKFVENSNAIQCCLDDVIQQNFDELHNNSKATAAQMGIPVIRLTLKFLSVPGLFKNIQAFRATGQLAAQAAGHSLTIIGKIGKELSKMSGTLNVFFLGVDIYNVVYHSKKLHAGCETQTSKWIRARVFLWRSEVNSWLDMYGSLYRAKWASDEWKEILNKPL